MALPPHLTSLGIKEMILPPIEEMGFVMLAIKLVEMLLQVVTL
jgi:hypothetical protein